MSRPHARRTATAVAGVALVAAGVGGLLTAPRASASVQPSDLCLVVVCLPTGGSTTPSSPPSPPASPPDTPPATQPSDPAPTLSVGGPGATYDFGSSQAAPSSAATAAATTAAPGPNLRMSGLQIRRSGGKLDVIATVSNTGTVALRNVGLTVSASGERTQSYVLTLNAGQHIRFHTRWPFKAAPAVKRVVAVVDPGRRFGETDESDNRVSGARRLR